MKSCKKGYYYCNTEQKCKPIPEGSTVRNDGFLMKEDKKIKKIIKQLRKSVKSHAKQADTLEKKLDEEGLRAWFGKSSGTTKSGRKVKGWVQVGGKYDGKPCARQPGQKTTPKCTSSSKRSSMSDKERDSAARRKRAADPSQPQKSGAAAPTMVSTDPKKKMKEEYKILPLNLEIPKSVLDFKQGLMFRESLDTDSGMLFVFDNIAKQSFHMTETLIPLDIAYIREDGIIESIKQLEPNNPIPVHSEGNIELAIEVNRGWFVENNVEVGDELSVEYVIPNEPKEKYRSETGTIYDIISEVKDKKSKGSGSKDACYHKVKSRYSVWPSAYASGALVKCRKVGAANWGNKSEAYEVTNADKKGNTPAYQGLKAGKKNKLTGKPLYKAAPHMKEGVVEIQNSDGQTFAGVIDIVGPANMKTVTNENGVWQGTEQISEMKRDEYGDPIGGPKISKKQLKKNLAANTPDEKHTTTTSEAMNPAQQAAIAISKKQRIMDLMIASKKKKNVKEENLDEKCWKGYEKKGMKTMFGKRYPNCVKKKIGESISDWRDDINFESFEIDKVAHKAAQKKSKMRNLAINNDNPNEKAAAEKKAGGPKLVGEGAAWTKKSGKSASGGLNEKGRKSYEKENPGSDLKAPSKKVGNKRRASFCARMKGMKKKLTSAKTARDPDSRINKSLRAWNC
tara:strand:- start:12037 stop:14073 length:2037 start_codon:yes stop_codon:yes gene_type:complete